MPRVLGAALAVHAAAVSSAHDAAVAAIIGIGRYVGLAEIVRVSVAVSQVRLAELETRPVFANAAGPANEVTRATISRVEEERRFATVLPLSIAVAELERTLERRAPVMPLNFAGFASERRNVFRRVDFRTASRPERQTNPKYPKNPTFRLHGPLPS
jgi:hypothetical protein